MMQLNVINKCLTDAGINVNPNDLRTVVDFIADKHKLNVMANSKNLGDLTEILLALDIRNGGRFIAYLTTIAIARIPPEDKEVLIKSLIDGSDEFVRDEACKMIRRIAMWFGLFR